MQHGLFACSESFLLNGVDATAYRFAAQGYDVWLGNNRGNQYGRRHLRLDAERAEDKKEFFDFSFYELAKYDLPANIDYVLKATNQSKVSYVGHSQGTTQMFTALAENIDNMTSKINVFIALAPITYSGGSHN